MRNTFSVFKKNFENGLVTNNAINNTDFDDSVLVVLAKGFADKLRKDQKHYESKEFELISDVATFAPRTKSAINRDTGLAKMVAFELFPNSKVDDQEQRKYSYIRYSQLISTLCKTYRTIQKQQEEKKKREIYEKKQKRYENGMCSLKRRTRELSSAVVDPKAMPVSVAPKKELDPFFRYIEKGEKLVEDPLVQFTRGVHYDDGRIDLCKQVVGPDHIETLMESIKDNVNVEHFLLGNNIINTRGAKAIAKFINDDTKALIKTWYIAGNRINEEGIVMIADALSTDKNADALWLKRNPLKTGSIHIANMLAVNTHLRILDLHNTGILDVGCKQVFNALRKNDSLRFIYMDANGITKIGASYIAEYFDDCRKQNHKGLDSLYVSINRIGDEGAQLIADSVKEYSHLRRLCMSSNGIEIDGLKSICNNLVDHPNLEYLDVGFYKSTWDLDEYCNMFGDDGAKILADFVKNCNSKLCILGFQNTYMTEKGVSLVADALMENEGIMYMYYTQRTSENSVKSVSLGRKIHTQIHERMKTNIEKTHDITPETFRKRVRFIKHTKRVQFIDSVYRNAM